MFRVVCDPSSGIIELYLTEIRSGSLMFVMFSARRRVHTRHWFKITLPNTD